MHHNTESLRTLLAQPRNDSVPNPATVEDTGEEYCRVCDHKRSAVDGEGVCLMCVMFIFMRDDGEGEIVVISEAPNG